MWNMKNTMLFVASLVAVILISMSMASANPVYNWFETEKNKTIEFQKKSWADGKQQLAQTKQSILNLFKKVTNNDSQN